MESKESKKKKLKGNEILTFKLNEMKRTEYEYDYGIECEYEYEYGYEYVEQIKYN